jgi:MFS family permease
MSHRPESSLDQVPATPDNRQPAVDGLPLSRVRHGEAAQRRDVGAADICGAAPPVLGDERGSGGEGILDGPAMPPGWSGPDGPIQPLTPIPPPDGWPVPPPAEPGRDGQPDQSIWRNRNFMLLWAAQAIGQTAHNAVHYGLMVLVQTYTESATHMSIAVLTVVVPSVIFGLVAGAYVDRRDKRRVLIGTNLLRAGLMPIYVLMPDWLWVLYAVNCLFSTISQFFAPAEVAMIPVVVGRRKLLQANSLFHITFTASQLGGLVLLGPLLVNLIGVDGLFATVGVALVLSAALIWPLPSTRNRLEEGVLGFQALWGEIRFVLRYVRTDRLIAWGVVQWTIGTSLALIVATLAPTFVVVVLRVRAEDAVFVLAPAGIGTVLGSLLLSRWGNRVDRRRLVEAALMALGTFMSMMALAATLWQRAGWIVDPASADASTLGWRSLIGAIMGLAVLAGFAFVAVIVPAQTLIQERALPEVRGRLFAVQMVLANVASIVPLVALGELADSIGVGRALLLVGLAVLGAGIVSTRLGDLGSAAADSEAEPSTSPAT